MCTAFVTPSIELNTIIHSCNVLMNRKGDPFYGAQNTSDIYYISIQLMIDGETVQIGEK